MLHIFYKTLISNPATENHLTWEERNVRFLVSLGYYTRLIVGSSLVEVNEVLIGQMGKLMGMFYKYVPSQNFGTS